METADISKASKKSVKWSLLTEFLAKIATPLSTAVLARLLLPEVFGIAAAVTIIVSFCEAITDTGFAKFIIQHDFKDEDEYKKYISISIIFSILLSILLFVPIFIFRYPISAFVGNEGYENILLVSCVQLPFFAINSIFLAHLRRTFQFNKVFIFRLIYCIAPFVITIPLALFGFGPWSLVIGAIAAQVLQTPVFLISCRKYIRPFFSFKYLGQIIGFSYLMIIESIIIWMSTWLLTFISTQFFDSHIVGVVKVANSTVTNIFTLFSTSFTNVLFATLSRLKDNDEEYQKNFYSIQSCAFTILVPLSIGCFFYANTVVKIFLGNQWAEAIDVVAILGLSMFLKICFTNFVSEVFRSKGHFTSSIIFHLISLGINIGLKFAFGKEKLSAFVWTTVIAYLIVAIIAIGVLKFRYKFSLIKQLTSMLPAVICCLFMAPSLLLQNYHHYRFIHSVVQIIICASCYFAGGFIFFKKLFDNTFSYLGIDKLVRKLKGQ